VGSIFRSGLSLEQANAISKDTAMAWLGIEITEIGDDYVRGTIPVDHRTVQPARLLHGGVSVLLGETLGSMASMMVVDMATETVVGLEVNANHLRPATKGKVTGTAKAIHIGRTTHLWEFRLENEEGKLTCIGRLTMAVRPK